MWARQDVRGRQEGLTRFKHPVFGRLDLEYLSFQVVEHPSLRLYLYTPADERSTAKLREIGRSLTTEPRRMGGTVATV